MQIATFSLSGCSLLQNKGIIKPTINVPSSILAPTTFKGQTIHDSPIKVFYETLSNTNISKRDKEKLLTVVYMLKRNYFVASKALQRCNLKVRYFGEYIKAYNTAVSMSI